MTFFTYDESYDDKFDLPQNLLLRSIWGDEVTVDEPAALCLPESDIQDNVFLFDKTYFAGLKDIVERAGCMATSMIKSEKYLSVIVNLIQQTYPSDVSASPIDKASTFARIRRIISKGFFVTSDIHNTSIDASAFILRDGLKRVIMVNDKLIHRLKTYSMAAAAGATEEDKDNLLQSAIVYMGCLMAHEAAHWLHSIIKPGHFYKDEALKVSKGDSPKKMYVYGHFQDVPFDDFGRAVECAYYGGAVTVRQPVDPMYPAAELEVHRAIAGINMLVPAVVKNRKDGQPAKRCRIDSGYIPVHNLAVTKWWLTATYAPNNGLRFAEVDAYHAAQRAADEERVNTHPSTVVPAGTDTSTSTKSESSLSTSTPRPSSQKRHRSIGSEDDESDAEERTIMEVFDSRGNVVKRLFYRA